MKTAADIREQRRRATLIGSGAVFLWGTLAVLTIHTGSIPPFQLVGMSFAIAFALTLCKWICWRQHPVKFLRQPPAVWMLGVGGLFGFHFFVFIALKNAPPVEASLINYLWPLLIVLFSALLPGEKLALRHVAGAAAGFAGTVFLVTRPADLSLDSAHALGYGAAVISALIWASYSLASSRQLNVATDAVGGFCLGTAVLAVIAHLAFERTVVPEPAEWLAVAALGAGPVGGAFFLWDYGIKRGSVRTLGAVGYLAPLISTVLLIAVAGEPASPYTLAGGLLIVGGAALAAGDVFRRRST